MKRIYIVGIILLLISGLFACSPDRLEQPATVEISESAIPFAPEENPATAVVTPASDLATNPAINLNLQGIKLIVVYRNSGTLWVSIEGVSSQLTEGSDDSNPKISEDGKSVVFQRGNELWAVDIAGKGVRKIFSETGVAPLQVEFLPGKHTAFFTTMTLDGRPCYDLNLADADVGSWQNLLPAGRGGEFTPGSGGNTLALVQPDRISIYNIVAGEARVVYQFPRLERAQGNFLPPIAWLENGYGFKTIIPGAGGQRSRLIFIAAVGGQPAQLAEFSAAPLAVSDSYISPDGSKVLYLKEDGENLEMHFIDLSTADKMVIKKTRGKLGILGWSPDSSNMIFWLDQPQQIWLSNGDASSVLNDGNLTENIIWLDPNSLLFISDGQLIFSVIGQRSQIIATGVTGSFNARLLP